MSIVSAHQGFVTEKMRSNTLSAFALAARKGAVMIETDARATRDGILIANHDPVAVGFDRSGNPLSLIIAESSYKDISGLILAPEDPCGPQGIPLLKDILLLAKETSLQVNINLKNGILHARQIAEMVMQYSLSGKIVYATNGAGMKAIRLILDIDPLARFIDKPVNFTREALSTLPDYETRCYAYTADFSDANIRMIRESGCMLACISLADNNILSAVRHHPEMKEYPHTSDFEEIEKRIAGCS